MKSLALLPHFWAIIVLMLLIALGVLLGTLFKKNHLREQTLFMGLFALIFSAGMLGLYLYWGASDKLVHNVALTTINDHIELMRSRENATQAEFIHHLDTIKQAVNYSHVALAHLGNIYMQLGMPEKAIPLFEDALHFSPQESEYEAQWIYAQSLQHQGRLPANVRAAANQLVQKDPQQFPIMNLLAIDDFFQANYVGAMGHWQTLLSQDESLTPERRAVLEGAILSAKVRLEGKGDKTQGSQAVSFQVKVAVAKELQQHLSPEDTIYVFIKAADAKGMPLAVVKRKASELPFSVTLDDSNAMVPGVKLSLHKAVQVSAKVSKSGNPLENKGDLRATSDKIVVESGKYEVDLLINERVL